MKIYWIWLSNIPYIGPVTANLLIERYGSPENVYNADICEMMDSGTISKRQAEMMEQHRSVEESNNIIDKCDKNGIEILTLHDTLYPHRAKMEDSPIVLYYKGKLKNIGNTVGIVGARRCTREARHMAIETARMYSLKNISIISGMAKGVDAYAHTSCIKAGGYTIAMMANGLDICYPKEHNVLMQSIIENGVVISEYPPEVRPDRYRFPRRNRLISAWSDKVVVIGAGHRSGALITSEYALKYGKDIQVL
jgi:DNA processing protein